MGEAFCALDPVATPRFRPAEAWLASCTDPVVSGYVEVGPNQPCEPIEAFRVFNLSAGVQ